MYKIYANELESLIGDLESSKVLPVLHQISTYINPMHGNKESKIMHIFEVLDYAEQQYRDLQDFNKKEPHQSLLSEETRRKLANALIKYVENDPKQLLHFAQNPNNFFNIVYPNLFPPQSNNSYQFKFYYDTLLEVMAKQLQDLKHRHNGFAASELLGAMEALDRIIETEPTCKK